MIEGRISECQAGFRKAIGCADQIFTLRREMEQSRDKKMSHSHYALLTLRLRMIRSIGADCGEYCGDMGCRKRCAILYALFTAALNPRSE